MVLVSARFTSKRGGGSKAVLASSGVAQNCARKFRVTILLRDPLTIPDINSHVIVMVNSLQQDKAAAGRFRSNGVIWSLGNSKIQSHYICRNMYMRVHMNDIQHTIIVIILDLLDL